MSQSYNANESNRNVPPTNTAVGSSQIPDLLKIGAIPTDTSMDVVTDILDPVVQNDNFVRFAFQNKGILHSMSKIKFGFQNATYNACLPINVGIYALIQRVRLTIGAKTVCEIDDFNQFMAYKGLFVSQEAMKEREQYLTSRIMAYGFEYKDNNVAADAQFQFGWAGSNPNNATVTAGEMAPANTLAEFVSIDNGWCPLIVTQQFSADTGGVEQFMNKDATQGAPAGNGHPIYKAGYWTNLKKSVPRAVPDFQVSIADLCPFLRTQQLPLYMMDELVQLEIFTSPPTERVYSPENTAGSVTLDINETQLIADYIYYPQEMMVAYANANRNLTFTYVDYRLSKYSIAARAGKVPTTQQIRNVGGAGRIVTRVIAAVTGVNGTSNTHMISRYEGTAPERDYSGGNVIGSVNGEATLNLKYNDTFLFPVDVNNNARHFHNTASSEGLTPFTTREVFSGEGESLAHSSWQVANTTKSFTGPPGTSNMNTALSGSAFYCGFRLNDQTRINSRGIELYQTWNNSATFSDGALQRVWLETIKQLTLNNGRVEIQYA